jgi:metal-responsive CopG/Arc/MetJ family transcriptional regulator
LSSISISASTVNISFQNDLLKKIDNTAKKEFRSRSELIREAARMYVEKRSRWNSIFSLGESIQSESAIIESEVLNEIKLVRRKK